MSDGPADSRYITPTNRRMTAARVPKTSVPPPQRWSQDGSSSGFCHATRGASQRKQRSRLALIRAPHEAQMTNPNSSRSNIEGLGPWGLSHLTPGEDADTRPTEAVTVARRIPIVFGRAL